MTASQEINGIKKAALERQLFGYSIENLIFYSAWWVLEPDFSRHRMV